MLSFRPAVAHPRVASSSSTNLTTLRRIHPHTSHRHVSKHVRHLALCTRVSTRPKRQHQMNASSGGLVCYVSLGKIYRAHIRQHASFWSWRAQSSWHLPGCKWVRSEGDPRQTPRDKDCPACQEESSRPTELSHRELIWQRQMQFMKEFMERDPYEALFGRSNDRLRGIFQKALWHESLRRPWPMKAWDVRQVPSFESDGTTKDPLLCWSQKRERHVKGEPLKEKPENPATKTDQSRTNGSENDAHSRLNLDQTHPTWHGYGRWRVNAKDSGGKSFEVPGEMVYDPITMRMVPSTVEKLASGHGIRDGDTMTSKSPSKLVERSDTEGRKAADAETYSENPKIDRVQSSGCPDPSSQMKPLVSAAHQTKSSKLVDVTQSTTPSMGMILREQRHCLQVIREVENELRVARAGLKALVAFQPSNSKQFYLTKVVDIARSSLRESQLAVQKFTTQLDKTSEVDKPLGQPVVANTTTPTRSLAVKETLEKSWLRENGFAEHKEMSNPELSRQTIAKNYRCPITSRSAIRCSEGHFQQTPQPEIVDPKIWKSYKLMGERNRALKHMNATHFREHRATLFKDWAQKHESCKKVETPADKKLNEEIKLYKAAMTAFENKWRDKQEERRAESLSPASNKSQNLESRPVGTSGSKDEHGTCLANTDRWHPRKLQTEAKDQQDVQDRNLVSAIKEIYETSYGVINENHRQSKVANEDAWKDAEVAGDKADIHTSKSPLEPSQPTIPKHTIESQQMQSNHKNSNDRLLYKILAYDPATQSIHTAIASSSFAPPTGDRILSIPDALPRLHHPAKFLPHFAKHQADGYEIVSANKNLLVFKRVQISPASQSKPLNPGAELVNSGKWKNCSHVENCNSSKTINPVDGTAVSRQGSLPATSTGNFASPTGFVNHDIYDDLLPSDSPTPPRPKPSSTPSRDNPRVRKEEAVFTGRRGKAFSRRDATPRSTWSSGNCGSRKGNEKDELSNGHFYSNKFLAMLKALMLGSFLVVSVLYALGFLVENSKDSAPEAKLPENFKPGFWAAVNREQARRAEAAEVEAAKQELLQAQVLTKSQQEETGRTLAAVVSAGVDAAMFGALLWALVKLLESSGR